MDVLKVSQINKAVTRFIRTKFTIDDEHWIMRKLSGSILGVYEHTEKDQLQIQEYASCINDALKLEADLIEERNNAILQNAIDRLKEPLAEIGQEEKTRLVKTGELDDQGNEIEVSEVYQRYIEPVPEFLERNGLDDDGNEITERYLNPLVTKDREERAHAEAIIKELSPKL